MIARLVAFFSAFVLLFSVPVFAYELPEEFCFLNVSSSSDASLFSDSVIMPMALDSVYNTVTDLKSVYVHFSDNTFDSGRRYLIDSGYISFDDISPYLFYGVVLQKGAFPPVGKYTLSVSFGSDIGGFSQSLRYIKLYSYTNNATDKSITISRGVIFQTVSGDWTLKFDVDLRNVDRIDLCINISGAKQFGGYFKFNWDRLTDDSDVTVSFPSYSSSDQSLENGIGDVASGIGDVVNGINDMNSGISELNGNLNMTNESIGHISSYLGEVNGHLENLIHTISLQLEALWNQMYNSMHVPHLANDDKNTDKIVDAIGDIDKSLNDSNDRLISNDNRLAESREAAEQQRQHNTLYGYDTSQGVAAQESAASDIEAYEDMEGQIIDSVSATLDSFELQSPDTVITGELAGAFLQISDWFQLLYDSSGMFHVILIVGLSLGVALMIIGFYRVQNGG